MIALVLAILFPTQAIAARTDGSNAVVFNHETKNETQVFSLSNDFIQCSIVIEFERLKRDKVSALSSWLTKFNASSVAVETDADFKVDAMWTDWQAPGKVNNAENPVEFSKSDFIFKEYIERNKPGGAVELALIFKGRDEIPLEICLTYKLEPEAFYARRKLAIRDSFKPERPSEFPQARHFLRWVWPCHSALVLSRNISAFKPGGFGQPVAFFLEEGGAFFGLEYPTSENSFQLFLDRNPEIACGQEMGERITDSWVESEWVVEGISPDSNIKLWFWKYLDRIRAAPLRPYLLYNSWYDLEAPEYVKKPDRFLNEANGLRAIDYFRKNLYEKRGLSLDAFVLDDGWDNYQSDWVVSKEQFPRGFAPFLDALKSMGTRFGLWLGPIGGYSNRHLRVGWMKEHGYEVVGDQMCVAGEHYHTLLKQRVTDFVRSSSVRYFKWDGIQFSCSEPGHGHLPDIYSRRAVMESVIDLCRSVRAENPDVFLNITSGTWLSPWWVKYANTIWMQGQDYGFANVPSISLRDRAITYRDFVLYDDLRRQDFWFPIANLMTHGIIKGQLLPFEGAKEPLEKFTDDMLLYLARGISMWELYISPDLLSDGQWNAVAASVRWAKDRFDVLSSTEMVGGDPGKGQPYGYAHFLGKRGILALRNPIIEPQSLRLELSPRIGLDADTKNLVLERVYPTRWISPELQKAGAVLEIPLQGFETAVYEIYPLEMVSEPLLAGVIFEAASEGKNSYALKLFESGEGAKLLNPERVQAIRYLGKTIKPQEFKLSATSNPRPIENISFKEQTSAGQCLIDSGFKLQETIPEATIALMLEPAKEFIGKKEPEVIILLNGKKVEAKVEKEKGNWAWYKLKVHPGEHSAQVQIVLAPDEQEWKGAASAWAICLEKPKAEEISFDLKQKITRSRPMPPSPFAPGVICKNIKLGETDIVIKRSKIS